MKIAIISDIHGNIMALDSVLNQIQKQGIEKIFVLGDLIGYYPFPVEVVRTLKALNCEVIQGNHERLIKQVLSKEIHVEDLTQKYGEGHEIALNQLTADELHWLSNLPVEKDIVVNDLRIKLCHGAPSDKDLYLYPDSSVELLKGNCVKGVDFICIGHSHYPFMYNYEKCSLINVGSVGQNKTYGGLASWGILDTQNRVYIPKQTPYDKSKLINEIMMSKTLSKKEYLIEFLNRNN